MEAKLSVEIGASVSKLTKDMATASRVVSTEASKIDRSTITLQKNINNIKKTPFTFGQNFQRQSQLASNSVNQLDNAVKKSRGNLQAWIYIIQDAPFGLMGIQNNLTQLIPGVGAASLAFSALISALTFSQVGMTYWNRGAKDTEKSAKSLKDALEEYTEGLDSVSRANIDGVKSTSKEIAEINALRTAIENETIPRERRLNAIRKIKEEYPAYFDGISTESLLLGKVSESYTKLTSDILAAGKARSAINLQAEEFDKINILDLKREKRQENINNLIREQSNIQAEIQSKGGDLIRISDRQAENASLILDYLPLQGKELDKLNTKYAKNQGIISKLKKEAVSDFIAEQEAYKNIEALQKNILSNGYIESVNRVEKDTKRVTQTELDYVKALKDYNNEEKERIKNISDYLSGLSGINQINKNLTKEISLPKLEKTDPLNIPIVSELDLAIMRIGEQASTLKNNIAPMLTDAFYSLGEAINSGDFSGFGEGILKAISGFIADLGQMFIKEGIMMIAAGIARNIEFPGSGVNSIISGKMLIAAGGLAAVGGGIVGSTSMGKSSPGYQVPKFADGVTGFSGGLAMVGERGPEMVYLPTGSNVITNENMRRYGGMNGGTQKIEVVGVISGDDINLVSARSARKTNRVT